MATRWGIISAGKISGDFACALISQDPEEHQVVAIAARSKENVQEFADKYGIKTAYGSYEELVENPDIDIVYIGSIHPEHHKLSKLCLNAGKNVLCEKPVTMTPAAAKEIFSLAKEKKLFFMEAFWTRFFPAYNKIRSDLKEGVFGDVKMVTAKFCLNNYHISRMHDIKQGGGGLLDMGCYTIMFADFVFNEKPEKISVQGQVDESGVDTGAAITQTYSGGRIASLVYSTQVECNDNSATILGTKGCVRIEPNFWEATAITTSLGRFAYGLPQCKLPMFYGDSTRGLQFEQNHVRCCLQKGFLESPAMTHESSLNIVSVVETVLNELGVKYDFPYTV